MSWKCFQCKEVFDEPDYNEVQESFEFWGSVGRHTFVEDICPHCGSDSIEQQDEEGDEDE